MTNKTSKYITNTWIELPRKHEYTVFLQLVQKLFDCTLTDTDKFFVFLVPKVGKRVSEAHRIIMLTMMQKKEFQ